MNSYHRGLNSAQQELIDQLCEQFDQNANAGLAEVADLIAKAPDELQEAAAEALLERFFAQRLSTEGSGTVTPDVANELGLDRAIAQRAFQAALEERELDESPQKLLPQRLIDRYYLAEAIGGGAFGVVGRYRDNDLNRTVAVKVARPRRNVDSNGILDEEALLLGVSDGHPGIVTLYDHIRFDDPHAETKRHALVMQHIDGGSLDHNRLLLSGWSAVERRETAVAWTTRIADAVGYLHRHDVLHRDLKPANVLLDKDGHLFVADFGLAWAGILDSRSAGVAGTPSYFSPQIARAWIAQIEKKPVDYGGPTTGDDIYALGVILYQLLTGLLPCEAGPNAENPRDDLLRRIARGDWDRQPLRLSGAGQKLAELVEECLAVDPKSRPETGNDLFERLKSLNRSLSGGGSVSAESNIDPVAPPPRRPVGEAEQAWLGTTCLQDPNVIDALHAVFNAAHSRQSDEPRLMVLRGETGSGRRYAVEAALFRFNQSHFPSARLVTLDQDGNELRDDGLAAFLTYQCQKRELPVGEDVTVLIKWLGQRTTSLKSTAVSLAVSLALDVSGSLKGTKRMLEQAVQDRPGFVTPEDLLHAVLEFLVSREPVVLHLLQDELLTDPDRCLLLGAVELLPALCLVFSTSQDNPPDRVTRSAPCRSADVVPLDSDELDRRLAQVLDTDEVPEGLADLLWSHGHGDVRQIAAVLLSLFRHDVLVPENGGWRFNLSADSREHLHQEFAPDLMHHLQELREHCPRILEFLTLASACGPLVPVLAVAGAMGLDEQQTEVLVDTLDDFLCDSDSLPLFVDRAYTHPGFSGQLVYEFRSAVGRIIAWDLTPPDARDAAVLSLLEYLSRRLSPVTRAIAQVHLELLETIPAASPHAFQLRSRLAWWGSVDDADRLRETLTADVQTGRVNAETLWSAINQMDSHESPLRRLAMLDAWAEQPNGIPWSDEWRFHRLLAESLEALGSLQAAVDAADQAVLACGSQRATPWLITALLQSRIRIRLGMADQAEPVIREVVAAAQKLSPAADNYLAFAAGLLADVLEVRGELDEALRIRREEELPVYERLGDVRAKAVCLAWVAEIHRARGELDETLRIIREEEIPVYERLGDVAALANAKGRIADVLQARGELDEALRIRREEELPVYERLGDVRGKAVTQGQIADVLQARGELDEALRIRREEQLPVFERLGDVREKAVTQGRIADVLQARGELDEALRIRREEELPVYERLGDVREKAVTQGKIADVLQARGELDEALRIRREEELPVYERLGDVREKAVTESQIADQLSAQGDHDEAVAIYRTSVIPAVTRLRDVVALVWIQRDLAHILLARNAPGDRDEAAELLRQAHAAAEKMGIPEADQIREIQAREGLEF